MKINPSDQCLSLCLRALQVGVLPEVTSDSACRAIELITITLTDLLKRHQEPAIKLLHDRIAVGTNLEKDIKLILELNPTDVRQASLANASFDALAKQYDQLIERLNGLCVQLSSHKSNDPRAAASLRRAAEFEMSYLVGQAQLSAMPFGDEEPSQAQDTKDLKSDIPLREFLQTYLSGLHGALQITEWSEVPGGFGKETYFCTVRQSDGAVEELVVRKSQPVPMVLHGSFLLEREYHLLRSLSKTDYPAPHPIDLGLEVPGSESTFYTMNRIPGKVLGSFLNNASVLPENIFKQLAELLAKLHGIPLETFADYFDMHNESATLTETVEARYRRNLKGWRDYIERVEHLPSPYITWLFHWLENNIPADSRRSVLTHGDFSVHNILGENGVVTGVLDWECFEWAAPEQDIAYIRPHVSKHMDFNKFLDYYKAAGGQDIDERKMPFCLAYGVLRTFIGGTRGSLNLQKGRNRDIRYVMMELGFAPSFMQMGLDYTERKVDAVTAEEHSE